MRKNDELLAIIREAIRKEEILEFASEDDALAYFITYDYQDFKTVDDMKRYQDEYGFGMNDKWYHINYDEVLDRLKEHGYSAWRVADGRI